MKISIKKILVCAIWIFIITTTAIALTLKLDNGVQYNDAQIIIEDLKFKPQPNKIEIQVSLGGSVGRMLINKTEIVDIELPNSVINPTIAGKRGEIKFLDINDNEIKSLEISPFDKIITDNKSSALIAFNKLPMIEVYPSSKIEFKVAMIDANEILLTDKNQPAAQQPKPQQPTVPGQPATAEIPKKEEFVFYLAEGELAGVFDKLSGEYSTGFLLDTDDALLNIKAPKFYVSYKKNNNGSTELIIFPLINEIKFSLKKYSKSYRIKAGNFVKIINGEKPKPPKIYTSSKEMTEIYKSIMEQ